MDKLQLFYLNKLNNYLDRANKKYNINCGGCGKIAIYIFESICNNKKEKLFDSFNLCLYKPIYKKLKESEFEDVFYTFCDEQINKLISNQHALTAYHVFIKINNIDININYFDITNYINVSTSDKHFNLIINNFKQNFNIKGLWNKTYNSNYDKYLKRTINYYISKL